MAAMVSRIVVIVGAPTAGGSLGEGDSGPKPPNPPAILDTLYSFFGVTAPLGEG